MSKYVADYVEDLKALGAETLTAKLNHPVLVLTAVAGTLGEKRKATGTMVSALTDVMTLSRLVGRVFPLVKRTDAPPGPVVVGRTADNDVAITDYSISNRHCYFAIGPGELTLYDCGSTNGTRVDGKAAVPRQGVPLRGGETIVIGRFAFQFFRPAAFVEHLARQP
jgi:pSer/pThr/pTyr-binding forkhead associated (FHA) protein